MEGLAFNEKIEGVNRAITIYYIYYCNPKKNHIYMEGT